MYIFIWTGFPPPPPPPLVRTIHPSVFHPIHLTPSHPLLAHRVVGDSIRSGSMASTAMAALVVTDELALPLHAVGDLAAAAGVSREEVIIIRQCTSLGAGAVERTVTGVLQAVEKAMQLLESGLKVKEYAQEELQQHRMLWLWYPEHIDLGVNYQDS